MKADIGIIGGSGFYSLLEDVERVKQKTKYGMPSDDVSIGMLGGKSVAFIPRHGSKHTIPPHKVPYRANVAALKECGITRIIASNAVGSLNPKFKPSEMAFFDQFVNMTQGRQDTFFDENVVAHISTAEPYCPQLRSAAIKAAEDLSIKHHKEGSIVVINGPRFSTKAESKFFSSQGFDMIGMTQYPEVSLAREMGICYLGVGLVTDYDAGLEGKSDIKPVTADEVVRIFNQNVKTVKQLIQELVPSIPEEHSCACAKALDGAIFSH
jgi:5'-methylthioadenosine phosphorylase